VAHLVKFLTESPEVVVLLLYLVVPGFVFVRVYDLLAPGERRSLGGAIIDTLGTSFIFMMFWFWPFAALYDYRDSLGSGLRYLILSVLTVLAAFVTPVLLAYVVHRLRRSRFLTGSTSEPSPTSRDWFFSAKAENCYVRFHLKTGETLGGYYGDNSFAASLPHGEEIYVEEVWRLDEDGRFAEQVEGTKGAFVSREDCTLMEFLEGGEASSNKDGHEPMAEEPNIGERIHGEGYESGKHNSPTRTSPGREGS
jgi:Family of unknown function (DUF6338)